MVAGVAITPEAARGFKKAILDAFLTAPGMTFAGAVKQAGATYTTAYKWRAEDPEFNAAVEKARADADSHGGDFAESKLMSHINDGNVTALLFYLKTKHKARGYVENVNYQVGGSGIPIESNLKITVEEIKTLSGSVVDDYVGQITDVTDAEDA